MLHSNMVFTPFYGKDAVWNRNVINHQTYFLIGGGVVNYTNEATFQDTSSEIAPSLSLGAGLKIFLKQNYAVNLELRNYTNFREDQTENRFYLGVSFGFRFNLSPRKEEKNLKMERLNYYLKEE